MIAIDSNVLIRFITQDDQDQFILAKNLIAKYQGKIKSIYINNIILYELFWVLRSSYKYTKQQISDVLEKIIRIEEFEFENIDILLETIALYTTGKADFADYLIYVINKTAGFATTYSFDQKPVNENIFKTI